MAITQLDIINSRMNPLMGWAEYRDFLMEVIGASGFTDMSIFNVIRSRFDANLYNDPRALAELVIGLVSPHELWSNTLRSLIDVAENFQWALLRHVDLAKELIVNGEFTTDTSGWTAVGSTIEASGGKLRILASGAGVGARQARYPAITLVSGATYKLSLTEFGALVGTGVASSKLCRIRNQADTADQLLLTAPTTSGTFINSAAAPNLYLRWDGDSAVIIGDYVTFDGISLRRIV